MDARECLGRRDMLPCDQGQRLLLGSGSRQHLRRIVALTRLVVAGHVTPKLYLARFYLVQCLFLELATRPVYLSLGLHRHAQIQVELLVSLDH